MSRLTARATLINYDVSLAYRRICNQGAVSMACLGLVKSGNSECGCACKPHRARPEAHIYGVALVVKERAIHGEARLVAVRFRSRRDSSSLIRVALDVSVLAGLLSHGIFYAF